MHNTHPDSHLDVLQTSQFNMFKTELTTYTNTTNFQDLLLSYIHLATTIPSTVHQARNLRVILNSSLFVQPVLSYVGSFNIYSLEAFYALDFILGIDTMPFGQPLPEKHFAHSRPNYYNLDSLGNNLSSETCSRLEDKD